MIPRYLVYPYHFELKRHLFKVLSGYMAKYNFIVNFEKSGKFFIYKDLLFTLIKNKFSSKRLNDDYDDLITCFTREFNSENYKRK